MSSDLGDRAHQVLRSIPTTRSATITAESYIKSFGADYAPTPIVEETTSGCGTTNGTCRPDDHGARHLLVVPDAVVELEEFTDVIGRNFHQPNKGWASTTPGGAYVAGDDPAGEVL